MTEYAQLSPRQKMPSQKLPPYVYLYFFCQSINLIVAVISVAVSAHVGHKIAAIPIYATVPYGVQFLLLLVGTYPVAMLMKRYGRKFGFNLGAAFLFCAGGMGYFALVEHSFLLLIMAHGLIGLFTACANFYRYAVTDGLPSGVQSKALSLVVAGGVIAGIVGPTLSSQLREVAGFAEFSLCYASLMMFALINLALIFVLPEHKPSDGEEGRDGPVDLFKSYDFMAVSICVAAMGYGLMNLLMIQSSLKMAIMHVDFEAAAFAIQWHVVAMFFPSFFTGILITRFGHSAIIMAGLGLFMMSFLMNIYDTNYSVMMWSLVVLGLGWNFTYVGGSAMLNSALTHSPHKQKWQGIGDTTIAVLATMGAMAPSFLLNAIGWENSNMLAMALCLVPIGGVLVLRGRRLG